MRKKLAVVAIGITIALTAAGCGSANPAASQGSGQAAAAPAGQAAGRASGGQAARAGTTPGVGGVPFDPANAVSGQVKSLSGDTIQVTTAGSEVSVKVSDSTQIQKSSPASLSDVTLGSRLVARGTRAADGTFTAQTIQIGGQSGANNPPGAAGQAGQGAPPAGGDAGVPQGAPSADGQGAPPPDDSAAAPGGTPSAASQGGRRSLDANNMVIGQVKQVDGSTIQLALGNDVVSVTVSSSTQYQKTEAGKLTDIVVGEQVTARGTRGADGVFTAQVIVIGRQSRDPKATPAAAS